MHTGSDAVATGRVVEIHPISASALARLRADSTITEQSWAEPTRLVVDV
jgi:hypothetical protein